MVFSDQEETQPPSRQHRRDDLAVKPPDDQALGNSADQADHKGGEHEHGDPNIHALTGRHDGGIAAEHDELAMRKINHAHHSEYHRKSQADECQYGDTSDDRDQHIDQVVHRGPSTSQLGYPPDHTRGTKISVFFGLASRLQRPPKSYGGTCFLVSIKLHLRSLTCMM